METVKYIVQIWDKDIHDPLAKTLRDIGTYIFNTFEDMWCFVDTLREHYEEPNNLMFDIKCICE